MYGTVQHSGGRARTFGLVTAALMTVGAGWVFTTGLAHDFIPALQKKMEVFILQPEKPQEVKPPEPPKIEKVKPVEVPPPQFVAPDIPIPPNVEPVITAPPAPPEPAPVVNVAPTPPAPPVPDARPKLRSTDKPDYPSASVRAGEQGQTKLSVCVTEQGRVQSVSVVGSSGSQRLDDAAASWLRGARFTPAIAGGKPTAMCGHSVIYEWNIKDARS
jgi:periplasmic protein TonB